MGALTLIVGAVSCVPAALCVALRGRVPWVVTGLLGHAAATGFLVALASSDRLSPHTTKLLHKTAGGAIPRLSLVLFWLYHLGLRTKLFVQRRKSAEPLYDQVPVAGAALYIGGWPEQPQWLPAGNPAMVDVTCELPRTFFDSPYLCLPTWDTQAPNTQQIQEGVEWARQRLQEERGVYIHCAHGHGRSATVMAALLMSLGKAGTAEEAVALMREARPRVRLNKPQAAALRAWIEATSGGKHKPGAGACMAAANGAHKAQ